MAYTYDDFLGAASRAGYLSQFDDDDLETTRQHPEYGLSMLGLKRDYDGAKTDEQRLLITETLNQLRNSYRLAGTGSGIASTGSSAPSAAGAAPTAAGAAPTATGAAPAASGETAAPAAQAPQSFAPQNPSSGTQVAGVKPIDQTGFTWDAENDPSMQAYRKQYLREGDRATAQALGQAAAASAGRPSTYAVSAATQAGDYYAGQLADKVPTLYQDAYNRFMTEQDQANKNQQNAYENLAAQIIGYGYMPSEEEMAQAGMTPELAQQMYQNWISQNPDAAYMQGAITPEQYHTLTGKWPNGYHHGGGRRGSSWEQDYVALLQDPSTSAQTINSWVMKKVNDKVIPGQVARELIRNANDPKNKPKGGPINAASDY